MKEDELFAAHGVGEKAPDLRDEFSASNRTLVRRDGECLLWLGTTNMYGYAVVKSGGVHVAMHRLIFEVTQRPLCAGEVVRHTDECRHRNCIEPGHLTAGTQADNMEDMRRRVASGRAPGYSYREQEFRARRRQAVRLSIPLDAPTDDAEIWPTYEQVIHTLSTAPPDQTAPLPTVRRVSGDD